MSRYVPRSVDAFPLYRLADSCTNSDLCTSLCSSAQWLESFPARHVAKKTLSAGQVGDDYLFEVLAAQVETMYSELDAVLREPDKRAGPEAGVKLDADGNVFIELVDSNQLQLDFRTVDSAIWKLLSTLSVNYGTRQYQVRNQYTTAGIWGTRRRG